MNRRSALNAVAGAMFGLPSRALLAAPATLPDKSLFARDPEKYWARLREEQFLIPGWRAYFNNGTLGLAPRPVLQVVSEFLNRGAAMEVNDYTRWGYETLDEQREELAQYLGCKKDELAITHNATEAMSTIAAGLDLKPGDEVVMTDQEHPSGKSGWQVRKARHGVTVREVPVPLPPKDPAQLADLLISAIGPKTRVISFSGVSSPTGIIFPVRPICDAARAKGVITVVDGAHMHGQIPLKISDLGCDFFAGSPHKWMFAPTGSGFLYVRDEMLDRLWPSIVTGGWDDEKLKAGKFMRLGTNNRAIVEGTMAGLRFGREIGHDRIYARIHQLARLTYERASALPYVKMITPNHDQMFGGLVTIEFTKDPAKVWQLCNQKKIFSQQSQRIRLSTHIHTRPSDIETFFDCVKKALG